MNPTEPKPQTPLTNALEMSHKKLEFETGSSFEETAQLVEQIVKELYDHARSLELKLQEAELLIRGLETTQTFLENENKEFERQRDELKNHFIVKYGLKLEAERDQLIKVVDKAVIPYKLQSIRTHEIQALIDSYSLLPHVVEQKKRTK